MAPLWGTSLKTFKKMSTDGDLSRSQIAASDVIHDFTCSPCEEEGKNSEAEYHCVECKRYFCGKCVELHNKILSSHTLRDKTAMKFGRTRKQVSKTSADSSLPVILCEEHPGEEIKMFCGHHDAVCCTVCVAVNHRSCYGVEYIPKIAAGQMKHGEQQEAKKSLEQVRHQLQLLMSTRKNNIKLSDEQLDECVGNVRDLKKRIVDRMEELERDSVKQVNFRHKLTTEHIQNDIKSIDDMLTMVDSQLDKINQTSADNDVELFINVKQGHTQTFQTKKFMKDLESDERESIEYELNTEIEAFLNDTKSLVSIQERSPCPVTPYNANLLGMYDTKVLSDDYCPYISGCCMLDEDHVIITDTFNDKLKRLNSTFNVTDWIHISGCPSGICKTSPSEVAVTLTEAKQVQFVSVVKTVSLSRSFSVGEACRGICYNQGKLYICCGGRDNEGPGQVKVYDMSGSELSVFQKDPIAFGLPGRISIDSCSRLYVADQTKGLIIVDLLSNELVHVSYDSVNCVSVDGQGSLFTSDYNSNAITQIDRRGNVVGTILSNTDGIHGPLTVTYLKNANSILVSEYKSSKIKVFKLN